MNIYHKIYNKNITISRQDKYFRICEFKFAKSGGIKKKKKEIYRILKSDNFILNNKTG